MTGSKLSLHRCVTSKLVDFLVQTQLLNIVHNFSVGLWSGFWETQSRSLMTPCGLENTPPLQNENLCIKFLLVKLIYSIALLKVFFWWNSANYWSVSAVCGSRNLYKFLDPQVPGAELYLWEEVAIYWDSSTAVDCRKLLLECFPLLFPRWIVNSTECESEKS